MVIGVFVNVYYMLLNLVSNGGVSLIELLKCKSYLVYALVEFVVVVQVGKCALNDLGTVVVVLVVAVVVWLYADIHHGVHFILRCICWGLIALECLSFTCWGLIALEHFIVHLLRAHALGCFNHPTVEGSCPGMLVIQRA